MIINIPRLRLSGFKASFTPPTINTKAQIIAKAGAAAAI
jgi:hypothetical protein